MRRRPRHLERAPNPAKLGPKSGGVRHEGSVREGRRWGRRWRRLQCAQVLAQSAPFEPVTDAMIQNPDPKDWLSWRRTLDSWGYSPLDEIDRGNVEQLRLVWVAPARAGTRKAPRWSTTGCCTSPGRATASPRSTPRRATCCGSTRRELPEDLAQSLTFPDTNRNLAIYGNLIIARGSDDHIYAVNAETGAARLGHQDHGLPARAPSRARARSSPTASRSPAARASPRAAPTPA